MDGVCIAAAVLVGRVCCRQRGYEAVDVNKSRQARKKGRKKKKEIYSYETVSPASYPCVEGIVKRK